MTRLLHLSVSALFALTPFATARPSWPQTLAGRPDRYGSDAAASPEAIRPATLNPQLRTRFLSWPGKVMPSAPPALRTGFAAPPESAVGGGAWRRVAEPNDMRGPVRRGSAQPPLWNPPPAVASTAAYPSQTYASQIYPSQTYQPQTYAFQTYASQGAARVGPASPVTPAPIRQASNTYARQTPSSIYDVPEPQGEAASGAEPVLRGRHDEPSTQALASPIEGRAQQAALATPPRLRPANGDGVRFYSVHRSFGIQPDPAPIPPQFFAATPDLSDPPGPATNRKIAAGAGVAARSAAQAQDGEASQP